MKKNNKKTIKSGDNKVIEKHKFIEEGPERYPFTKQEIIRIFSCPVSSPNMNIDNIATEIWEKLCKNPKSYDVDEFGINGDDLILFYKGKEIDRMHLTSLVKWALDIDSRWNCHWIKLKGA